MRRREPAVQLVEQLSRPRVADAREHLQQQAVVPRALVVGRRERRGEREVQQPGLARHEHLALRRVHRVEREDVVQDDALHAHKVREIGGQLLRLEDHRADALRGVVRRDRLGEKQRLQQLQTKSGVQRDGGQPAGLLRGDEVAEVRDEEVPVVVRAGVEDHDDQLAQRGGGGEAHGGFLGVDLERDGEALSQQPRSDLVL